MKNIAEFSIEDFAFKTYDKVRYSDTDRQGHVNNAVFSKFLETGRVEILYDPNKPLYSNGCSFVIVKINSSLISEIKWPGIVEIGTGISNIGNSSITFDQCLFQNDKVVAVSETVIVQIDDITKKSHMLSESTKDILKSYLMN
jgi:acyl-CoA thioester hydrolase